MPDVRSLRLIGVLPLAAMAMCSLGRVSAQAEERNASALSVREAGVRYGQALGAIEICHGSKLTDKANSLGAAYQGADQDTFKASAARVYEAWLKVKACANQRDPNQCKIIMDKSCLTAEAEVGAQGSVVPGLVEFRAR